MAQYVETKLHLRLPEGFSEADIADALDNLISEFGGELVEAEEFTEDNLYSDDDFDTPLEEETEKIFSYQIKETLIKTVKVMGEDEDDAYRNLQEQYTSGNIILTADDFDGVAEVRIMDKKGVPESEWFTLLD